MNTDPTARRMTTIRKSPTASSQRSRPARRPGAGNGIPTRPVARRCRATRRPDTAIAASTRSCSAYRPWLSKAAIHVGRPTSRRKNAAGRCARASAARRGISSSSLSCATTSAATPYRMMTKSRCGGFRCCALSPCSMPARSRAFRRTCRPRSRKRHGARRRPPRSSSPTAALWSGMAASARFIRHRQITSRCRHARPLLERTDFAARLFMNSGIMPRFGLCRTIDQTVRPAVSQTSMTSA